MKAQDLKNSILQLAIQGKLVEQREEEGTAKELIEKIQAEKEQLIKEKKIKKEKPLPEITEDEIPFDIPESWEWVRFGEMVNFNMGKTPPRSEPKYWKDDYNWVSIADMIANGYIHETKEKISEIVNDNHLIILDSKLENLQNIINDKMNKDLNFMILEEGEVMENLIEKLKSIQLFNGEFNNGKV